MFIDLLHGFFDPRGRHHHPAFDAIGPNLRALAQTARGAGIQILHATERHRPGPDFEFERNGVHFLDGSREADTVEWLAAFEPLTVTKRRFSAFFATDLDLLLRERAVQTVVIAGVKTNLCIRATAQDAFSYGYDVVVVEDAVASNRHHLHRAALEDVRRYMGTVVPASAAMAGWSIDRSTRTSTVPSETTLG